MNVCVALERIRWHRRNCAAGHGIAEKEALKKGMEEKSKEFVEKDAEVYAKV